jgi:hypothetical protein
LQTSESLKERGKKCCFIIPTGAAVLLAAVGDLQGCHEVHISMNNQRNPGEHVIAERISGTIKEDLKPGIPSK